MNLSFTKHHTQLVKGIAILFMIILHCASGPDWWSVQFDILSSDTYRSIMGQFKICVAIYAFLIGFGYFFSKQKDLSYSLSHIRQLLSVYWVILLGITVPAIVVSQQFLSQGGGINMYDLLLNMFGIKANYNYFCWFVSLYLYSMFILPVFARISRNKPIKSAIAVIGVSYLLEAAIAKFAPEFSQHPFIQTAFNCFLFTPIILLGYLFAHYKIYNKIKTDNRFLALTIAVVGFLGIFYARSCSSSILGFNLDFFYAPVCILCILLLFSALPNYFSIPFTLLGKYSVYMWFIHALFFTKSVRDIFQPFLLISDNLLIVTLWCILLTLISSMLLKWLVDKCTQYMKKSHIRSI